MNNLIESNCTESIMSKYLYIHSSLVLNGTSFDSSYQLQLSCRSFDRTLSLSVHVLVPYESVETVMNLIVREEVRHELTNTVAVRSGIGQILELRIQSHSCRFPTLYCPGTPYRSHDGPINRTNSWMIQNPSRREDVFTCKIWRRLYRLVGNGLLKVEGDMWNEIYPEDFGYIYAGLLNSSVHYM